MSAEASDRNFIALNLSSQNNLSKVQDALSLNKICPIGKTWDKHRTNADIVSNYYATAGENFLNQYAWRMRTVFRVAEISISTRRIRRYIQLKTIRCTIL